jgi:hypothetical protein
LNQKFQNFQRENLTDYERFKVFKAKQHKNRLVRVEMGKLKKEMKAGKAKAGVGKSATGKPMAKKAAKPVKK